MPLTLTCYVQASALEHCADASSVTCSGFVVGLPMCWCWCINTVFKNSFWHWKAYSASICVHAFCNSAKKTETHRRKLRNKVDAMTWQGFLLDFCMTCCKGHSSESINVDGLQFYKVSQTIDVCDLKTSYYLFETDNGLSKMAAAERFTPIPAWELELMSKVICH